MKIMNCGIEFRVNCATVVAQQDEHVLADRAAIAALERFYDRETQSVYLMPGSNEEPVLLIEWAYWLSEDDQYDLLYLSYDEDERYALYDLHIL